MFNYRHLALKSVHTHVQFTLSHQESLMLAKAGRLFFFFLAGRVGLRALPYKHCNAFVA